ncbi:16S rRNA (guanine(527)-N(7))-methyltransferase RsmG [Aeromicrobium sp. UC242_57]|uniref:16S rRNA (guanine(527)-N(7))-methyltransferase RsmG n=1 Tax=Aeromicrobium sp. UC242_57 TaxID=3374624 RepID=UPI0037965053
MFASRLPLAEEFAYRLATHAVVRGLIGPREVPRIWDRHMMNSAVVAPSLPNGATVADIGTGAGLPGLVSAIARPDIQMTLVEPLLRRTSFLDEVVRDLQLDNVEVVRARAEEVNQTFDVVTARAVAALDKLGRWCMPLVRPGGVLLAMKGRTAADEIAAATATLHRLGRHVYRGEDVRERRGPHDCRRGVQVKRVSRETMKGIA